MSFAVRLLSPLNVSGETGWVFEGDELPAVDDAVTLVPRKDGPADEVVIPFQARCCEAWILTVDPDADPAIRALLLN
jgi:hypothetical protein